MFNSLHLLGLVDGDAQYIELAKGGPLLSFTLAVPRPVPMIGGPVEDRIPVIAQGTLAESLREDIRDGRQIIVEGSIRERQGSKEDSENGRIYVRASIVRPTDETIKRDWLRDLASISHEQTV